MKSYIYTAALTALALPILTQPVHAVLLARIATLDGALVAGVAVDAYADFDADYLNQKLTITLHNLGVTPNNTLLLDGIAFNLSGTSQNLAIAANGVRATTYYGTIAAAPQSNVDITGGWQLGTPFGGYANNATLATFASVNYGYTLGSAAFSGASVFAANLFTLGGGGDDYSIIGSGTSTIPDLDTNTNVQQNQFPMAYGSVRFTLNNFTAAPSQTITSATFLYGSAPAGTSGGIDETPPPVNTPEPGSAAVIIAALGLLGVVRRRQGGATSA